VTDADGARRRAAELLEVGLLGGAPRSSQLLEPIAVVDPADGRLHSWFVPAVVGERIVGFAELRPDFELLRYASFPNAVEPAAWTDPATARARAAELARAGETLGDAVLSYDRDPSRIAWLVTATDAGGRTRRLVVAGDLTYEQE
jgi:hypothetical protein